MNVMIQICSQFLQLVGLWSNPLGASPVVGRSSQAQPPTSVTMMEGPRDLILVCLFSPKVLLHSRCTHHALRKSVASSLPPAVV